MTEEIHEPDVGFHDRKTLEYAGEMGNQPFKDAQKRGLVEDDRPKRQRAYSAQPVMTRQLKRAMRTGEIAPLTPADVAGLRALIRDDMLRILPQAVRAVEGEVKWTSQQVNLFRIFMNKIVPDLSMSHQTIDVRRQEMAKLSREELEAIAGEATEVDSPTEGVEDE